MVKISKIIKIIILAIGLVIIILTSNKFFGYQLSGEKNKTVTNIKSDKNELFFRNNFTHYSYFIHDSLKDKYSLFDENKKEITSILFTEKYCSEIKGYADAIPLAICFDSTETIHKIIALENNETPSFFNKLTKNNFFDNWKNINFEEALNKKVDAISCATYSSEGVEKTIIKRIEIYLDTVSSIKRFEIFKIIGLILSFMVFVLAVISFILQKKSKALRIVLLLSSIGIIGFWQGEMLNTALLHNWLINGIDISSQIFLFIVLLTSILIPIITNKQFYCYYLCPFGSAQEMLGKFIPRKLDLSGKIFTLLKYLRFVFLFVIFLFIVLSLDVTLENLEPFMAFNFNVASLGVIILAVVILILSFFINRPWCRFFCPTGAFLSLFCGPRFKLTIRIKTKNIYKIVISILGVIIIILSILLIKKHDESTSKTLVPEKNYSQNDAITTILKRKSVREYTNQRITKDTLELILKAGMSAPSAKNLQPWKFYAIQNKEKLEYLGSKLANATMLKNASAAIIVCGDLERANCEIDSAYWVQDCCAASENILLACEALKLGSVWTAVYPYKDRLDIVKEALEIPDKIIPLNIIAIGYPAKEENAKNKWDIEKIIWKK